MKIVIYWRLVYNRRLTQLSIAPVLLILCNIIVLILTPAFGDITTLTREQVDRKCNVLEDSLKNKEECNRLYEIVENNEAGDHYVGPDNPAITEDLDRESDLGYNELCDYIGGEWKDNKCEFNDNEKERKYEEIPVTIAPNIANNFLILFKIVTNFI